MTSYMFGKEEKIFEYPRFAEPFKDKIRSNIEAKALEQGISIEFIRKKEIRKESIISEKLKERGTHSGIVHRGLLIISKSRLATEAMHRLSESRVKLASTMPGVGAWTESKAQFT